VYAADMAIKATRESSVEVIEEKNVAEYRVTVLKATSASELTKWLNKNGYSYDKADTEKVEYYVKQGGFYFVALKVDASHFNQDIVYPMVKEADSASSEDAKMAIQPGWWWGELSPIQISFATDKPQLPMRTLKSDNPEMVFDLYTMSEQAVYIPGVDTIWSNRVDNEFLKKAPALAVYSPKAKWLLRQEVTFVPSKSNADVYLTQATTDDFTTVTAGKQARFNPKALDVKTGIVPGIRGQVVTTDGSGNAYTFTRSLTIGSVGEDVRQLQKILNAEGFIIAKTGPGSVGNESAYFGPATKAALIKYQNYYRTDLGITAGTGYFGSATMKFVNR
jgi:peptidoglycan hydrolase-like protein with peptidoglycan-binding domain